MTAPANRQQSDLNWAEEWVEVDHIIMHAPWQVRAKLDDGAITRYANMTKAGSIPPPVVVGRVKGKLYLLDGWHRMTAGAIQSNRGFGGVEVLAKVATMDTMQARWEAAKANMGHGVPLKSKELHGVFKAFIKAKRHIKPDGSLMSYREIAPFIGKPHTTIRSWTLRYFPTLAATMGGHDNGNEEAGPPPTEDLAEEHRKQALEAVLHVTQTLDELTPAARWEVLKELDKAREATLRLGVEEPGPDSF